MADTSKSNLTYEDIKKAVFYSQQKPELLADIIAEAVGVSKDETHTTPEKGEGGE